MGIRKGSLTATKFKLNDFNREEFFQKLEANLFRSKDLEHLESNEGVVSQEQYEEGLYIAFQIKVESLRVSQSEISHRCNMRYQHFLDTNDLKRVPREIRREIKQDVIDELTPETSPSQRYFDVVVDPNKKVIYVDGLRHTKIESILASLFDIEEEVTLSGIQAIFDARKDFDEEYLSFFDTVVLAGGSEKSSFSGINIMDNDEVDVAASAEKKVIKLNMTYAYEEENFDFFLVGDEDSFYLANIKASKIKELHERIVLFNEIYEEVSKVTPKYEVAV